MTVQGLMGWYKQLVPLHGYDRFTERLERFSLPRAPVATTESSFAVRFLKERFPRLRVVQAEHAPNRAFQELRPQPQVHPLRFIAVAHLLFPKATHTLFHPLSQ